MVDGGAGGRVAALFCAAPATPFLMLLITVFLVVVLVVLAAGPFRTTVDALPSLVSLLALMRRPVRVAGLDGGAFAAAGPVRLVRVDAAGPEEVELVFEVVVTFRLTAARDALAFSTMLESTFVAATERDGPVPLSGEPGRAIWDFAGDAGRSLFARRELEDVGDNTCPGLTKATSAA